MMKERFGNVVSDGKCLTAPLNVLLIYAALFERSEFAAAGIIVF